MKTIHWLLIILVMLAAGGTVLSLQRSQAMQAEMEELEEDMFRPNAPPVGDPVDPADLSQLTVHEYKTIITGDPESRTVPMNTTVIVGNLSDKVLTSVTVRMTEETPGQEPYVHEHIAKVFSQYHLTIAGKMLLPGTYAYSGVSYDLPLSQWNYGATTKFEIIDATYIDPREDLHDGDKLMAFLRVAELDEITAAFEKDPSLFDVQSHYFYPPVLMACGQWNPAVIDFFIQKGQSLKTKNVNSVTGLHLAAANGSPQVIAYLAAVGLDVDAQDVAGKTPLYWAAEENRTALVKALLEAGADTEVRDNRGRTPLFEAAASGNTDVLMQLAEAGADLNVRDKEGIHPLHIAADEYMIESITYMVNKGVDVDIRNPKNGMTPLHYAVAYGSPYTVKLLLHLGADPTLKTADGSDLYAMIEFKGNATDRRFMEQALVEAGIKPAK